MFPLTLYPLQTFARFSSRLSGFICLLSVYIVVPMNYINKRKSQRQFHDSVGI